MIVSNVGGLRHVPAHTFLLLFLIFLLLIFLLLIFLLVVDLLLIIVLILSIPLLRASSSLKDLVPALRMNSWVRGREGCGGGKRGREAGVTR